MAKPLMLLPVGLFAALAGLLIYAMSQGHDESLPSALVGQVAPAVPQAALGDYPGFDAQNLADGQVKLVNFFASWCAPCRVEHPNLMQLSQDIPIYGISYKDQPRSAVTFLQDLNSPYSGVVTDPDGKFALEWGVYGVPETYVIDGQGRIVDRIAGPVTQRVIDGQLADAVARASSQ